MKLDYNQLSEGHSKTIIFHGSHVLVPCSYFFQQLSSNFFVTQTAENSGIMHRLDFRRSLVFGLPPPQEVGSRGGARAHIPEQRREIEPNLSTA